MNTRTALASLVLVAAPLTAYSMVVPNAGGETDGEITAYDIDSGHSTALFKIRHFDVSNFYGRFNTVSGRLLIDGDDPSGTSIQVVIPTASIDTNSQGRDDHMKSDDFLASERFPELRFESTRVKATEGGYAVTGKLSVRDVEKEITLDVEKTGEGETPYGYRVGFEGTFTIDRMAFGIGSTMPPQMLGQEIEVTMSLEAVRAE